MVPAELPLEVLTEASTGAAAEPAADIATDIDTDSETEAVADAQADPADGAAATAAKATPALPHLQPAAAAELLRQHFPALFGGPFKPLKLRIQQDIQQRTPGVFSKSTLSAFFRRHTGSTGYLIALTKANQRFDLDGQAAGELTEEHRTLAQDELNRRRQVTREREQVAQAQQREAQRETQAKQREEQRALMAQQAEQQQGRQERTALLRDFQRTTLTLANFCALKGMAPEVLNPLLEQAKKEAAEAPPAPPPRAFEDRRGPRRDDHRSAGPRDSAGHREGAGQRDGAGPRDGASGPRPAGAPTSRPGPRRDDRRPPRPAGQAGPRGPRGPAGQS